MAVTMERISPQETKEHMKSGALLICAYDSTEKFQQYHLEGAMSLAEFRAKEGSLPRDREVIFY